MGAAQGTGEPGQFHVDVRSINLSPDQAERLKLAGYDPTTVETGFSVLEASQNGSRLTVRVPEFVDIDEPFLWVLKQPPTFLLQALKDGLASINGPTLADRLASGHLSRPVGTATSSNGLFPKQQVAYQSCLSPGIFLVWGPPGTGKTMVLKEAIGELINRGQRVLLVSGTNIAVDNALLGAVASRTNSPGQIVRVGPPQLLKIAQNHAVSLPLLVSDRLVEIETKRRDIWAQLADVKRRSGRLRQIDLLLAGFVMAEYKRDQAFIAAEGLDPTAQAQELGKARAAGSRLVDQTLAAATELSLAIETKKVTEDDRQRWSELDTKRAGVDQQEDAATAANDIWRSARTVAEDSATALKTLEERTGLSALFGRRKLGAARAEHLTDQTRSDEAKVSADEAKETARQARLNFDLELANVGAATSYSQERIAAIDKRVIELHNAVWKLIDRQHNGVLELARTEERGRSVAAARARVDVADRLGLQALELEAAQLRARVALDAAEQKELEKRYKKIEDDFERLSRDAEEIIINEARVVATTLARFRTNKRVFNGKYDAVLIDEVGAATLPEVLLAVSKAGQTAVMFGDFMQLGPILPSFRGGNRGELTPQVENWVLTDVFEHCGVDSVPTAIAANSAIIGLHQQNRFGPAVMGLVNSLAYGDELKAGPAVSGRTWSGPEIVVIDTDGLGSLAQAHLAGRRSGWWPAGLLLSRMLADFHSAENMPVGIITPYTVQSQATLEGIRDLESDDTSLAEVGTAHRFQGREFPTVIFDTVEGIDGGDLWMAMATLNAPPRASNQKWRRDGVRLFNVAATRVQSRLYIIGSLRKIKNAPANSAFGQLARLIGSTGVECLRGPALITPLDTPADELADLSDIGIELRNVLQKHVVVTDVDDETQFFATLKAAIDGAHNSLWIWSPWVAKRVTDLLPELSAAQARGVRITVFVRDENDQLQRRTIELVNKLRPAVERIIPMNIMHQKIIVVDDTTVMIGSINALSQSRTREIMITMKGGHFARRILRHEHAKEFSNPPTCPCCHRSDIEIRRRANFTWYWRCYNADCPGRTGNVGWNTDITLKYD